MKFTLKCAKVWIHYLIHIEDTQQVTVMLAVLVSLTRVYPQRAAAAFQHPRGCSRESRLDLPSPSPSPRVSMAGPSVCPGELIPWAPASGRERRRGRAGLLEEEGELTG